MRVRTSNDSTLRLEAIGSKQKPPHQINDDDIVYVFIKEFLDIFILEFFIKVIKKLIIFLERLKYVNRLSGK